MRLSVAVLTGTLLTASLVACSNGYGVPPTALTSADGSASKTSVAPVELHSSAILANIQAAAGLGRPDAVQPLIYASVGSGTTSGQVGSVYAYPDPDKSNGAPVCSIGGFGYPSGIAVDRRGDLIVPDRNSDGHELGTITVYKRECGPEVGSVVLPYPVVQNVASLNAANGEIVAGYLHGNVSVCTLAGGCTTNLTTPYMSVYGVALAPNGDCWASGTGRHGSLAYFAHCRGHAVFTHGLGEAAVPAGLDIDNNGNLVLISSASAYYRGLSQLDIYSGCDPKCKHVGGPFQLKGGKYGHLDANSKHLVVADSQNSQLDVYSYSTNGIRYEYSISNGLPPSTNKTGAAFSPPSIE